MPTRKSKSLLFVFVLLLFSSCAYAYDCRIFLGTWDITAEGFDKPWIWEFNEATIEMAQGEQIGRWEDGSSQILYAKPSSTVGIYIVYYEGGLDNYITINGDTMQGYWEANLFGELIHHNFLGKRRPGAETTTTTTMPSSTPCPAKTALGEQASELPSLRSFRDGVMKRSDQGRAYAELYYRHAVEISSLLEAHPEIKGESQRLILKLLPTVQAMLAQKDGKIDAETVTQAAALLDNLSALGSPSIKADFVQLKKELQSGRLFEELNILVAR